MLISGSQQSVGSLPRRSDLPFQRRRPQSMDFPQGQGLVGSSGYSLDGLPESWPNAVLETGRNAISTLLQPPIVRTGRLHAAAPASSAYKPLTALDIPPVTLANIAQVDAAEFKPYLDKIGEFYKSAGVLDDDSPGPEKPVSATRISSGPSLTDIPTVYFSSYFHLENPRIFDVVTERSELVPAHATGGPPRKALATTVILQEKYILVCRHGRNASHSLYFIGFRLLLHYARLAA